MKLAEKISIWWFRPPAREHHWPIILGRKRVYILPTGEGIFFSFVLLGILLGAINYEISLGHALVFLLAGLGFAALFQTFRNVVDLEITPGTPSPVFVESPVRLPLHIFNRRQIGRTAIELHIDDEVICQNLLAKENQTVLVPQKTFRRGRMAIGRITLSSRYPLGFFRAWAFPYPYSEVLVYPKPIKTPLPPLSPIENPGGRAGNSGQEDFAGFRNHRPSDPPKHIAWKTVAKNSEEAPLLVKEFSGGAASELWFDFEQLPEPNEETRLSIITGWVLMAEAQEIDYGLKLPEAVIQPARGENHQRRCLEALALHGAR